MKMRSSLQQMSRAVGEMEADGWEEVSDTYVYRSIKSQISSNSLFINSVNVADEAQVRIGKISHFSGLFIVFQSAYKQFHSTQTALLKVHNDATQNMDKGKVTALTLLDLCAAFDTIGHSWQCFSFCHSNRLRRVKIANCFSNALHSSPGF